MENIWQNIIETFIANQSLFIWLGSSSALLFVVTLATLPLLITRIPEDYFTHKDRHKITAKHPLLRILLIVIKNLWGYIFILVGIALIFLPGQGLLTIFIGIMLIDFPGKYRFECWLVKKRYILNSLNWVREKNGKGRLKV